MNKKTFWIGVVCCHDFVEAFEAVFGTRHMVRCQYFVRPKTLKFDDHDLRSVLYCGAKIWNDIPVETKASQSARAEQKLYTHAQRLVTLCPLALCNIRSQNRYQLISFQTAYLSKYLLV